MPEKLKKYFIIILLPLFLTKITQSSDWQTFYEKSGYKKTPRYEETLDFCQRLADHSGKAVLTNFGTSPQGRELLLMIIDKYGNFTPEKVRETDNAVLLVQACIHSGECDGKDAMLMLLRDILIDKKYTELLDHVTILFMPIFNVDGHERFGRFNRINQNGPEEMGWRTTAQNLNLNRDYLKADAPEMQAWLRLFNKWIPDFFIDTHVTDGADYQYVITYGLELFGNMTPGLTLWQKENYLKPLKKMMDDVNFLLAPYVSFRNWHDPRSGLVGWVAPPMLSEGYTALQNRPGLLIETHMLKDYRSRVTATYYMIKNTIEILDWEYLTLKGLIRKADESTASPDFRKEGFPVRYASSQKDSSMLDFKGVKYQVDSSDLSGGLWFKYSKDTITYNIPYFNTVNPVETVKLPEAYIIPAEWDEVIKRLKLNGIKIHRLKKPVNLSVDTYKFSNAKWSERPFEGRFRVSYDIRDIQADWLYPPGSAVIDMNQRAAKVAAYILEPKADGSYAEWGFFNTIFEQKEYSESYVMEKMAKEMLRNNPSLKEEFEEEKAKYKADKKEFTPRKILNWFYERSPYWDYRKDIYPVGKIFDKNKLKSLLE